MIDCPRCGHDIEIEMPLHEKVTCQACSLEVNVANLCWTRLGIKVDQKRELRCPYCNKLFAVGEYSDRPQVFKCRGCGQFVTFQRIA